MSIQPIIDSTAIRTLRELCPRDNDAFLRELLGMFMQDTPLRIAEMEESLKSNDATRFKRAAHSIKGSSANIGAVELKEVAGRLESDIRYRKIVKVVITQRESSLPSGPVMRPPIL